jgi:hypothetical protein
MGTDTHFRCSHVPDKVDGAVLGGVVLENSAGKVR